MIGRIQKLKSKKGFTLVELIVVIAIIAILTAVIVPLVGRYSAQARYTTLNDTAQTIANSANSAVADANQIGVITSATITGEKTGGALTFSGGTGSDITQPATNDVDTNSGDTAGARFGKRFYASLLNALHDDCSFVVVISNSSVESVVYAGSKLKSGEDLTGKIITVPGYDYAYALADASDNPGTAVGVMGSKIPHDSSTPATT